MKNGMLLFAAWCLSAPAWGQVQVSVAAVNAAAGSQAAVSVSLSEGQDITAIQLALDFDLSRISVPNDQSVLRGDLLTDHSVGVDRQSNRLSLVIFSSSLSKLKAGSGTLVSVIFQVAAEAPAGTTAEIQLSSVQASDVNGNSVAVTLQSGSVIVGSGANVPTEGSNELIFPQVANGDAGTGSFGTSMVFVSRSSVQAFAEIRLFLSDGTPFELSLKDGRVGSSFSFTVPPGGTVLLETDGNGPLSVGYARLISTAPLGGVLVFTQLDGAGHPVTEAGVGVSPLLERFAIPVLYQKGVVDTGIAFANVGLQSVTLTLTLRNDLGEVVGQVPVVLTAGQHLPRFASEFFSALAQLDEFSGSIEVSATLPVSTVALRLKQSLLTTFPVIEAL